MQMHNGKAVYNSFDLVRPICLDHSSVIQNFFKNAILRKIVRPEDISHTHDDQDAARGLIKDKHSIEDYDDLTNVLNAFRRWCSHNEEFPRVLHAHGINSKGDPIDATWQALNRFQSNRNIRPLSEALNNYEGPGVFLTLTINHEIVPNLKNAWEGISKRWNIFMTRLSKELGVPRKDIHYIWVLEAQANGYPHIHALFLGIDWLFWAGKKKEWINDNPHSKNLKHFWKWGSVYVNSTRSGESVKSPIDYMMKYIRKTFDPYSDDSKKELTQALLWAFKKRSWNTSRGILAYLNRSAAPSVSIVDEIQSISDAVTPQLHLEEMLTFEYIHGQTSPFIRIVKREKHEIQDFSVTYTTSDHDIDKLAELVGMMEATYEEQKALDWLLHAKSMGKSYTYTIFLKEPQDERMKLYREIRRSDYLRAMRQDYLDT